MWYFYASPRRNTKDGGDGCETGQDFFDIDKQGEDALSQPSYHSRQAARGWPRRCGRSQLMNTPHFHVNTAVSIPNIRLQEIPIQHTIHHQYSSFCLSIQPFWFAFLAIHSVKIHKNTYQYILKYTHNTHTIHRQYSHNTHTKPTQYKHKKSKQTLLHNKYLTEKRQYMTKYMMNFFLHPVCLAQLFLR